MQCREVETDRLTNAEQILRSLDSKLNAAVDLTLYGRAAIVLGFKNSPPESALSHDVDAVFWLGQTEELLQSSNFWTAVEAVNRELAGQELYISHFFEENQVILRPDWRSHRVRIQGGWIHLVVHRLGDIDLFLSKLMRDDSLDLADARFIVERAGLTDEQVRAAIASARVPDVPEIREQFEICTRRFLGSKT